MYSENKITDMLVTKKKAAKILSISVRTLDRLIASHPDQIKKIYLGGSVRIRLKDIHRIIEQGI
jgi:hypothetical protein